MDNLMVPTYINNHCYPRYAIASVGPPQRGAAEKQVRNDNKKIPRQSKKWTRTAENTCFLEIYHR